MSVLATQAALDAIERLSAVHGRLAFFQSGGCCDGSSPICLEEGDMPPGPDDLLLGTLGQTPFYIDAEQHRRWCSPSLVLDVPLSPNDLLLGSVGGMPFYIDADQYERWGRPDFLLDTASGSPEGFSLGLPDLHLVTRTQ